MGWFVDGVGELGELNFALAYAGDAEYMWLPDNRKHLYARVLRAVHMRVTGAVTQVVTQ